MVGMACPLSSLRPTTSVQVAAPFRQAKMTASVHQPRTVIVRSTREEDLQAMESYKKGLDEALLAAVEERPAPQPEIVEEGDLPEIRGDNFWANIKKHNGMVVVLAYTSHCIPCKTVKPEMAKWAKELEGQVAFYKFALTLPNKERALELGVKSSPAFMIFKKGHLLEILRGGSATGMAKKIIWANK